MPLIDEHGRVLGRWNLIDAAVVAGVVLLVPIGYGAFRLFRTPTPIIATVEPSQVPEHAKATLRITGENIRPYLRARLGTVDLGALLVESPTVAEVRVPDSMLPGSYDLVLLDEARELTRKSAALSVVAPLKAILPPSPKDLRPEMEIQVVGAFSYMSEQDSRLIKPGLRLERRVGTDAPSELLGDVQVAQVLATRAPEVMTQRVNATPSDIVSSPAPGKLQVPAILNLRCIVATLLCRIGNTVVMTESLIPMMVPVPPADAALHPPTPVIFRVDEMRPTGTALVFPADVPKAEELSPPQDPAQMDIQAVGEFVYLTREEAGRIRAGAHFGVPPPLAQPLAIKGPEDSPVAEVLITRPPEPGTQRVRVGTNGVVSTRVPNMVQVPAIVRLRCAVLGDQCRIGQSGIVQPGELIRLQVPRAPTERPTRPVAPVIFRIAVLRPVDAPLTFLDAIDATVRVRFFVRPEILDLVNAGDLDIGEPGGGRAALTTVAPERVRVGAKTTVSGFEIDQDVTAFQATVKVPCVMTPDGLQYKGKSVKLGAPFVFEATNYVMEGWIQSVQAPAAGPERR